MKEMDEPGEGAPNTCESRPVDGQDNVSEAGDESVDNTGDGNYLMELKSIVLILYT